MKNLRDFILESESSKTITFNFKDLENAEDTIKSLESCEGVSVQDQSVTVTVSSDTVSKIGPAKDILQQFSNEIRNSSSRTNNEMYAQKTKEFENKVTELNDAIKELENPEEGEKDEKKD